MDIRHVVRHFGGTLQEVADALGVSYQAVQQWQANGIPLVRQFQIERKTKGKLKAETP